MADLEGFPAVEPHEPTLHHLGAVVGMRATVAVGDSGHEVLIAALHVARTYRGGDPALVCAVVSGDAAISARLRRQAAELALPSVHVVEADDPAVLAACLAVAARIVEVPRAGRPTDLAPLFGEV